MPDPDRLLRTLWHAIDTFRLTPGRRGRTVYLENATDVLAAGDMHGHVENFRQLLVKAELAAHPQRHFVLQEMIHGRFFYPQGGEKSHQLLDLLAALKCQYPERVHMLLGNHELAQWTGQWIGKGDDDLNQLFRQGIESAYGSRANEVYAAYLELFAAVPLALKTPNRILLTHSLPSATRLETFDASILERDEVDDAEFRPGGSIYSLVWGRDTSDANAAAFVKKLDADLLITGHIPCDEGFARPNDCQLILDCTGAPASYCLFPTDRPITHDELVACVGTL